MKRVCALIIFQLSVINGCSQVHEQPPGDFAFLGVCMVRAGGDTFRKQLIAINLFKNCGHIAALSFDTDIFLKAGGTGNMPPVFTSPNLYLLPGQRNDTVALSGKWIIGAEFIVEEQDSLTGVLLKKMRSAQKVVDEIYSATCINDACSYCNRPGRRGSHLILQFARTSVKTGL